MNNKDKLDFNGSNIKIEDIFKKPTKEILIGLYIKTQDLEKSTDRVCEKVNDIDKKIDNQWKNIGKNKIAISWIKGVLFISLPLISAIIGYIAYTK